MGASHRNRAKYLARRARETADPVYQRLQRSRRAARAKRYYHAKRRWLAKVSQLRGLRLPPLSAVGPDLSRHQFKIRLRRVPTDSELAERAARKAISLRLKYQRRRSRKFAARGRASASDVLWLRTAQRGRCFYCTKKLGRDYHVDHFIPLARGGSNERNNLRLACPSCNIAKSDKMPEQFMGALVI